MAEKCPYCYRPLGTHIHDPILLPNGAKYKWISDTELTEEFDVTKRFYKGLQSICEDHLIELQNNRRTLEAAYLPIGDRTTFSPINNTGKFQITGKHIKELRESTEKLLDAVGANKTDYFNYDEDGNHIIHPNGDKINWTDNIVDTEWNKFQIKNIHIEDLRHNIPSTLLILLPEEITYTIYHSGEYTEVIIAFEPIPASLELNLTYWFESGYSLPVTITKLDSCTFKIKVENIYSYSVSGNINIPTITKLYFTVFYYQKGSWYTYTSFTIPFFGRCKYNIGFYQNRYGIFHLTTTRRFGFSGEGGEPSASFPSTNFYLGYSPMFYQIHNKIGGVFPDDLYTYYLVNKNDSISINFDEPTMLVWTNHFVGYLTESGNWAWRCKCAQVIPYSGTSGDIYINSTNFITKYMYLNDGIWTEYRQVKFSVTII
jgi:hypothetical protein